MMMALAAMVMTAAAVLDPGRAFAMPVSLAVGAMPGERGQRGERQNGKRGDCHRNLFRSHDLIPPGALSRSPCGKQNVRQPDKAMRRGQGFPVGGKRSRPHREAPIVARTRSRKSAR